MSGLRILIVEDEPELGEMVKSHLQHLGHEVSGPALSCSAALELIWSNAPDMAFVDTHLGSETCEAVIDECELLGIPIVVTHAWDAGAEPACCSGHSVISKSYSEAGLNQAVGLRLTASAANG